MAQAGPWQGVLNLVQFRRQHGVDDLSLKWLMSGGTAHSPTDNRDRSGAFVGETHDNHIVIFPVQKSTPLAQALVNDSTEQRGILSKVFAAANQKYEEYLPESYEAVRVPLQDSTFSVEEIGGQMHFCIAFRGAQLSRVSIPLSTDQLHRFQGNWAHRWGRRIRSLQGLHEGTEVLSGYLSMYSVNGNQFASTNDLPNSPVVLLVTGEELCFFPGNEMPSWNPIALCRERFSDREQITVLIHTHSSAKLLVLEIELNRQNQCLSPALEGVLRHVSNASRPLPNHIANSIGLYYGSLNGTPAQYHVLHKGNKCVSLLQLGIVQSFQYGFATVGSYVLIDSFGEHLSIHGNGLGSTFSPIVSPYQTPGEAANANTPWQGVFSDATLNRVSTVEVFSEAVHVGSQSFPFAEQFRFAHQNSKDHSATIAFYRNSSPESEVQVTGPVSNVLQLCRAVEKRRTAYAAAGNSASQLYGRLIEKKKLAFAKEIFGDVLLINRSLNDGIPMDEFLSETAASPETIWNDDAPLKKHAVEKLTLLTIAIPRLRQKFELLRLSTPYAWAESERQWLTTAFGENGERCFATANGDLIQSYRSAIGRAQSEMQRSLSCIEAALRPLNLLLARDEVQKTRLAQIQQYSPLLLTGAGALAAFATGPIGSVGYLVMAGLTGNTLSMVAKKLLSDREAEHCFRQAAREVFPWWRIFLRSLAVAADDISKFFDKTAIDAMRRDRKLFDALPPDQKSSLAKRLPELLAQDLAQEASNQFVPVMEVEGLLAKDLDADLASFMQGHLFPSAFVASAPESKLQSQS